MQYNAIQWTAVEIDHTQFRIWQYSCIVVKLQRSEVLLAWCKSQSMYQMISAQKWNHNSQESNKTRIKTYNILVNLFQDITHDMEKRSSYLIYILCFHFNWISNKLFFHNFPPSIFFKVFVLWYSDGVPFMFVWITRDVAPGNWVPGTVGPGHTWFLSCLCIFSCICICICGN